MGEAGRLAEYQAELRGLGIPFDVVMAPYQDQFGGSVDAPEIAAAAADLTNPNDPDRNFPIIATTEQQLQQAFQYNGAHPGHLVLNPEREIIYSVGTHNAEQSTKQFIIDAFNSGL